MEDVFLIYLIAVSLIAYFALKKPKYDAKMINGKIIAMRKIKAGELITVRL